MKAIYVNTVIITDPDTGNEVSVQIFKEESGGMFGVDASYLQDDDAEVNSVFGNGLLNITE